MSNESNQVRPDLWRRRVAAVAAGVVASCGMVGIAAPASHADLVSVESSTGYPSDDCSAGKNGIDAFVGDTFVRYQGKGFSNPNVGWVCVRIDGPSFSTGGKFVIDYPGATAGTPTTDNDVDACGTAAGNQAPGPHPLLAGAVGDPSEPTTYVPFTIDTYASSAAVWICFSAGPVRERFVVPVSAGATPPSVTFVSDAPGRHVPAAPTWPQAPSGDCQAYGGTRSLDLVFDYSPVRLDRAYAYSRQSSPTVLNLCVGYVNHYPADSAAGGVLTVDTTGTGGALPTVTTASDTGSCVNVVGVTSPTTLAVGRSTGTSLPASVCITVGAMTLRLTADAGTGVQPPVVTWTPDPGTP